MRRSRRCGAVLAAAVGIAVGVTLTVPRHADATVVLCKRKNKLTLRLDACARRETRVEASELGVTGPRGDAGSQGNPGAPGVPGVSGLELVTNEVSGVMVNNGDSYFLDATCPAGKKVIGGGCNTESGALIPIRSIPNSQFWECRFYNSAAYPIAGLFFGAYAVCATTLP
jgi:hypothetical protein